MLSISIHTQFMLWNLNRVFDKLAIDYGIEGVFEKTVVINFIEYYYFYLFGVASRYIIDSFNALRYFIVSLSLAID